MMTYYSNCDLLSIHYSFHFSYPGKIVELLHRTNAYVPVGVAALLKEKPNLISLAVLAFCNRDPIDMKVGGFTSSTGMFGSFQKYSLYLTSTCTLKSYL